jgi:peptidoglycan/LPS O-acetylase OafA/YrhL
MTQSAHAPAGSISQNHHRLGGLDGLRAFSILFVIIFHLSWRLEPGPHTFFIRALATRASWGVNVFFVISGFLITWLLVSEQDKSGNINLPRFYQRRFLRILPPAFTYLLAVRILATFGILAVTWADVAKSALFVRNVARGGAVETVHFWSLSIEEQFYLFWPLFMMVMRRSMQIPATVFLVALAPIWAAYNYHLASASAPVNPWRTDINYDLLLIGCLIALGRHHPRWGPWLRGRHFQRPLATNLAISVAFGVVFMPARLSYPVIEALRPWLFAICVAVVINFVIEGHRNWLNRALDFGPIVWIGRISYSLYLWQQLFCFGDVGDHWMRRFPQCVLLTFGAAAASYYFIELPTSRLRSRFKSMRAPEPPPP